VSLFETWVTNFKDLDKRCPWPGPRPLTSEDEQVQRYALVARADEVDDFLDSLLEHSLMVLHGESGVGKSSLLNVGLLAELRTRGYAMLVCNQWADDFSGDVDALLHAKLVAELGATPPAGEPLVPWLGSQFGDRAVVVFDQFEEMIRYEPELFRSISDWVVNANSTSGIRIVLSLRSEYVHELNPISSRAKPFSMSQFRLPAFTRRDQIEAVIRATDTAEPPRAVIDPIAAAVLADAWEAVPEFRPERGLLFMQAVLYRLHHLARLEDSPSNQVRVELEQLSTLMHEDAGIEMGGELEHHEWTADEAAAVFAAGLRGAVRAKLDLCGDAADSLGDALPPGMVDGVRGYIRRAVRSLSSGGYKLVREQWDLAAEVLRRELHLLSTRVDDLDARAQANLRQLSNDLAYLERGSSTPIPAGELPEPWDVDPQEVTSGLLLGSDPLAALDEELRRVVFALQWLETSAITRTSSVRGNARTTLIHDGFGPALEQWSDTPKASALAVLSRSLRTEGELLDWSGLTVLNGLRDEVAHHVNLRWFNCEVRLEVEHAVFVNCDFRGTHFTDSFFRGVVFLNCLMDNVSFEECTFIGSVPEPTENDKTSARQRQEAERRERELNPMHRHRLPSFKVEGVPRMAAELGRLWGTPESTCDLVSVTSGIPAIPYRKVSNEVAWDSQGGGASMVGGRLSSMLIRRCRFDDGGVFAIRHTAGSSLDIVEQTDGRFLIFDSSVRGLSVSPPIGVEPGSMESLTVEVTESALVDTWFNSGLNGSVTLTGCRVWQLFNASDSVAAEAEPRERALPVLEVRLADCGFFGLVNVTSVYGKPLEGLDRTDASPEALRLVREMCEPMIYRSTPARYELELRKHEKERDDDSTG